MRFRSYKPLSIDLSLLILRVFAGLSMAFSHGYPKLQRALSGEEIRFFSLWGMGEELSLWLAILAELVASLLVVLGLLTRWALIPLIFTMGVVVFVVSWEKGYSRMELAVFYLLTFVALFLSGPGKFSVDARLKS